MADSRLGAAVQDTACQVMTADPTDAASVARLVASLEELEIALQAAGHEVPTALTECQFRLATVTSGHAKKPEKCFEAVATFVRSLQDDDKIAAAISDITIDAGATELPKTSKSKKPGAKKPKSSKSKKQAKKKAPANRAKKENSTRTTKENEQKQKDVPSDGGLPANRDKETIGLTVEFLHEAYEGLSQADEILLAAETETADQEMVDALFRVFHTIKGVSGFLNLTDIASLAHQAETMLDRVRDGDLELSGGVLDLTFDATRLMNQMLDSLKEALAVGIVADSPDDLDSLIAKLEAATNGGAIASDPLPIVDEDAKLGEVLVETADVPKEKIEDALGRLDDTGRKLGEELVAEKVAEPKKVARALRAQSRAKGLATAKIKETIRVDVGRVDRLVESIGELVIVETMVAHAPDIASIESQEVRGLLERLNNITRNLQSIGMSMRMVPLRGVFQKISRLVRDLSHKNAKQIRFTISGEDAEMDRGMVDRIADPLVHMIRNAVDHGIESPVERKKAGKPIEGQLTLSASHQGGAILIEVTDDGRGLDTSAILEKAVERGVVREGAKLSDSEIFSLIFAPGFSTATEVTEISGRGVGMDVVKRNVEAMRGRISVSSEKGVGSTFQLMLPLTLAVIDGTLVRCGSERYIIPTLSIVESVNPSRSMIRTMKGKTELFYMRGQVLPLLRLSRIFKISNALSDPTKALVVVLETDKRRIGLLVDEVIAQQSVVIKTLGPGLADIKHVAGASILSDGQVGLILNVDEIGNLMDDNAFLEAKASDTGGPSLEEADAA